MKGGLLTAWLAEVVLITYRTVVKGQGGSPIAHLPLPSTYVSTMIVYGGLGLFPDSANAFTAAVGWGLVVATALNLWTPGGKVQTQYAGQAQAGLSKQPPGPPKPPGGYPSNVPIV